MQPRHNAKHHACTNNDPTHAQLMVAHQLCRPVSFSLPSPNPCSRPPPPCKGPRRQRASPRARPPQVPPSRLHTTCDDAIGGGDPARGRPPHQLRWRHGVMRPHKVRRPCPAMSPWTAMRVQAATTPLGCRDPAGCARPMCCGEPMTPAHPPHELRHWLRRPFGVRRAR